MEYEVVSDFETVALIGIFLVLSFIIVRLIGGDADAAIANGTRRQAEPPPSRAPTPQAAKPSADTRPAPIPARAPPPAATGATTPAPAPVTTAGQSPDEASVTVVSKPSQSPTEAAMVKLDLTPPTATATPRQTEP
ncbi:MAG: hypothetical protein WBP38_05965, partial [Hyphomicrobium sp.]